MLLGGNVSNDEQSIGLEDRNAVLEHEKNAYRAIVEEAFAPDVEKCFNAYVENNMSSRRIANNASNLLKRFNEAQKGTKTEPPAPYHTQIETKKLVMDEACALEQRIETRYATRAAKFFRGISYLRQRYQLNRIKKALGINKDQKVADVYVQTRLNDLFVDTSDHKLYDDAARNIDPKTALKNIASDFAKYAKADLPTVSKEEMKEIYGKHINNVSELSGNLKNERYTMDDVNEMSDAYYNVFGRSPYQAKAVYVVEEDPKPKSDDGFFDDESEPNIENKEDDKENDKEKDENLPVNNESDSQDAKEEEYNPELEEAKRREAELAEEKARQLKVQQIRKKMFDKNIRIKENLIKDYSRELNEATALREKHLNQAKESLDQLEKELNLFKSERDNLAETIGALEIDKEELFFSINQYAGDIAEADNKEMQSDMNEDHDNIIKSREYIIKSVSDKIEELKEEIKLKENQKNGYAEKIQNTEKDIEALKKKIGDLQVVNKNEFELNKQVKELESEVKLWRENEQDMIETGKWLEEVDIDTYQEEPEDYEEPIYDEINKVRLSLNIDDKENAPKEPKIENPSKNAIVREK